MNTITELLNLEDSDILISDISIQGTTKTLTLETKPSPHYCPVCGFKMHSRGVKQRTIKHPVLQDNYELILILKQRRWRCTNRDCSYDVSESFKFVNKRRRTTNATDMLIVLAYRNLMETSTSIANRFYVSDTYPLEERAAVKYLISDMYNQYINYVDKYFPNAVPVVDSFHVIQWITRLIDNHLRQLLKKFRARDKEREDQLSFELQQPVSLPPSDEVYLLRKYRWLVLSSQSNIKYHTDPRIDPKLRDFRDLKEVYIRFNNRNAGNPIAARAELSDVIKQFHSCEHEIFREFADLLEKYQDPIINSFVMVEKYGHGEIYDSRLSNGPMEALNRKVKDLKRLGRGYKNFEHFRNRFLYSTRSNPILNGSLDSTQVQYFDNDDF